MKKMKKPLSGIIVSQNGMIQAEKQGKILQSRIPFILDSGEKIPKKEKILKQLKNHFLAFFFSQNGIRQVKKWKKKKKIQSRIPFILYPGKKISKKIAKKFKKLKNFILALFLAKTRLDRSRKRKKKFYSQIPFIVNPGNKILKKIAKKFKKSKNLFSALFLAKTG